MDSFSSSSPPSSLQRNESFFSLLRKVLIFLIDRRGLELIFPQNNNIIFRFLIEKKMARSLSNVKIFSAFFVDGISSALTRRGYSSAASQGGAVANATKVGGARSNSAAMGKKSAEKAGEKSSSWVPDPVTGHYRPENLADEIDVAELRQMLLKQKN